MEKVWIGTWWKPWTWNKWAYIDHDDWMLIGFALTENPPDPLCKFPETL